MTALALRLAAVVVAASLAGPAPAADIPALVTQLSADDYRVRERAGAELLTLGHQAVPHLKAALAKSVEPEATRRLEVLVERLESISFTEPTRITLKVERKPAKEVFAELARQSGCAFTFENAPRAALVSFDWRGTPFLQTLDQLCGALKLNWRIDNFMHLVVVWGGDADEPYDQHVMYVGPFRVCADTIALKREFRLSSMPRPGVVPPPPGLLTVEFSVRSEPRLPICAAGSPVVLAAEDEFGNSLLPAKREAESSELPTPRGLGHVESVEFPLIRASRFAASVKTCRVRVVMGGVTARRPEISVPDVAGSQGEKFTGRTHLLQVGETVRAKSHLAVDVVVSSREPLTRESPAYRSWKASLPTRFEAFDKDGCLLQKTWDEPTDNDGASVTQTLYISRLGGGRPKAVNLHFVEWVVKYQTVEFAFKDLPMP